MVLQVSRGQTVFVDLTLMNISNIESGRAFARIWLRNAQNVMPSAEQSYDFAIGETITKTFPFTISSTFNLGLTDVDIKIFDRSTRFADAQVIAELLEQDQININQ
ncbi:hypothetical protein LCGC14_2498680 [marine sediment metagenome]|uniref:Cohesin domain-containing protein n=1 Tax=marine sediment metagenome TaxID=412755 RepID=A0A0F9B2F7_9ZZZZ